MKHLQNVNKLLFPLFLTFFACQLLAQNLNPLSSGGLGEELNQFNSDLFQSAENSSAAAFTFVSSTKATPSSATHGIARVDTFWYTSNLSKGFHVFNSQFQRIETVEVEGIAETRALVFNSNSGTLFIGDYSQNLVYEISTEGTVLNSFSSGGLQFNAIAYDPINDYLYTVHLQGLVVKMKTDGTVVDSWTAEGVWTGAAFDSGINSLLLLESSFDNLYEYSARGVLLDIPIQGDAVSSNGQGIYYDPQSGVLHVTSQFGDISVWQRKPSENSPPELSEPEDISFFEDDSLNYLISNFYPFTSDANYPDSALSYTVKDTENIWVSQDSTFFVFKASPDWFGMDSLWLVASDGLAADSAKFLVNVNPVNDPPISSLPDSLNFNIDSTVVLSLAEYAKDIDSPDSSLSWNFESNQDSLKWEYDDDSKNLFISALSVIENGLLFCFLTDDSNSVVSDTIVINAKMAATNIAENPALLVPSEYKLHQNNPNPFNPQTSIRFSLIKAQNVNINVYDLTGRKIANLFDGFKAAGEHSLLFNAGNLASGIYFYQLKTDDFISKVYKMVLMK